MAISKIKVGSTEHELQTTIANVDGLQEILDGKAASSHTHNYAGSSSAGGAATSANKLNTNAGSATQPVYFSNGVPVATTYTLEKSVPSNAVFTDTNTHYTSKNVVGATNATSNTSTALSNGSVYLNSVENGAVTSSHKISGSGATTVKTDTSGNIIISSTDNNTTYSAATTSAAGLMSASDKSKLDAITASADAVSFSRSLSSGTKIGTITINGTGTDLYCQTNTDTNTHYTTGITAGASGTTTNAAATNPYVKIKDDSTHRSQIRLVGSGATTVSSDASGNITISSTDNNTTYSAATQSAAGLMSASDKTKLDGIASGANNYTYSLPTASSSTLGGVKTTSTVTSTSGLTACPIISGVPYYKDTNTTYSLSSFGVTATATELNYCDGVTSNIQTQLNGKAASSHTHSYVATSSVCMGSAVGTSSSISLANSTQVIVPLTSWSASTSNIGSHASITSNGIKILTTGVYLVSAACYINAAAASGGYSRDVYVKNASGAELLAATDASYTGSRAGSVATGSKVLSLSAGDYLYLYARTAGTTGTASAANSATYLSIQKIS